LIDLPQLSFAIRDRPVRVDTTRVHDISIPLMFDAAQPSFFGAPPASSKPLAAGTFVGDVTKGGSCNCATYTLTPHCNGTHTESVGHVTRDHRGFRSVAIPVLSLARLVTVTPIDVSGTSETTTPKPKSGDLIITRESLENATPNGLEDATALVIRTTPNPVSKLRQSYGPEQPSPYFSAEAMRWIVAHHIDQLVVDLPSVDRAEDEGQLTTHRIFWGLPSPSTTASEAKRPHATITELAYIGDEIADGPYLLNLQLPPFQTDAAPSRPLLIPLVPT
jgi:kynurenine formamidase